MRRGRGLRTILFNTLFVVCALALVLVLTATGAGLLAVLSVFVAIILFFLSPFVPSTPEPVFVPRLTRKNFPRAPPRS